MKQSSESGKIILIPASIGEGSAEYFTAPIKALIYEIDYFMVENERSTRRFLRSIGYNKNFDAGIMQVMQSAKNFKVDTRFVKELKEGKNIGVISEAGCPGIADPGSVVVRWAHENNIKVTPIIGPSSVFLALMASGLNGQQFVFHGYLPVSVSERKKKLKQIESESKKHHQTQIFIETPYRNNGLAKDMIDTLQGNTLLCIASEITMPTESIKTKRVSEWKNQLPDLNKKPTIFLLQTKTSPYMVEQD